jgi:hypothetical protein
MKDTVYAVDMTFTDTSASVPSAENLLRVNTSGSTRESPSHSSSVQIFLELGAATIVSSVYAKSLKRKHASNTQQDTDICKTPEACSSRSQKRRKRR